MTAPLASRVADALSTNGFLTTGALAHHFGVGKLDILSAYDAIEAAGIKLLRVRGPGGGAEIDPACQPEGRCDCGRPWERCDAPGCALHPELVSAALAADWPENPVVRACTGIADMPARRVPGRLVGQPAFLAKRMRRRMSAEDEGSPAKVAARLAELGVFSAEALL